MIDVPEMIVKNHPNQKFWLTISLRQEPFVSGSQGPPFPPTFKLAVLGIPSKKRVVGSNGDGMGVLNERVLWAWCMLADPPFYFVPQTGLPVGVPH